MGYKAGSLELGINVLSNTAVSQLKQVATQLTTIQKTIQNSVNAINKLNVKTTTTENNGSGSSTLSSIAKNVNLGAAIGKIRLITMYSRRLGEGLSKSYQAAVDYNETLNLWQVAMRNNLGLADEFIQKMNKAYGVSEQTLMKYQAIFKNMLSALGNISEESSDYLSQYLTQMALDFSSLYNVTIDEAMNKFQAVLSGQVRPIRSISGYDITENTIYDIYQKLGGEKTMRQLSQTEKRLLRIYAVMEQMNETGALGDMSKTIEQSANQLRIMNSVWEEVVTWVGMYGKQLFESIGVLQYINGILITVRDVVKDIYKETYGLEDFTDNIANLFDNVTESVEETKSALLGFDKFRTLDSSATSSNLDIGVDSKILELLSGYSGIITDTKMKANELAKAWKLTLGYTEDENGELVYSGNVIDTIENKFSIIVDLANLFKTIWESSQDLIGTLPSVLESILAVVQSIIGLLTYFFESYTGKVFMNLLTNTLDLVAATLMTIKGIIDAVVNSLRMITNLIKGDNVKALFSGVGVTNAFKDIGAGWSNFGKNLAKTWTKGFATGGLPDKGTMFYAGESGAELVGNIGGGQSAVMNMEQLQSAITIGMIKAMSYSGSNNSLNSDIIINIDGEQVFEVTKRQASRHGLSFSRV